MPQSSSTDSVEGPPWRALYHDPAPVGGIAVAVLLGTYGLFGLPVDGPLLVAGFCGTTLAYAVDRVWRAPPEDQINHPERVAWIQSHVRWLAAETAVLVALAGAMVPFLRLESLLWTLGLGGVAALRVFFRGSGTLLTSGPQKPIMIAGAWAAGGTVLPLVEAEVPIGEGGVLFMVYRWAFILPNLLLADWRDREGDAEAGLAPWAVQWTAAQVRGTATAVLGGAFLGAIGWAVGSPTPVLVGIDAVGPLLMLGAVWGLDPARPRDAFLTDLVVAWPIVPALVAWMIV